MKMTLITISCVFLAVLLGLAFVLTLKEFYADGLCEQGLTSLSASGTVAAAIGTVGAIIWAIYHQLILAWLRRPKLRIMEFFQDPPYFRKAAELDKNGNHVSDGYYINILLKNIGGTLARSSQACLTAMGTEKQGEWERDPNWLTKGLKWSFGSLSEPRNLIPEKDESISLGKVTTLAPSVFFLSDIYATLGQLPNYGPGIYCFEITAFAENAKPAPKKYIHVEWDGGCSHDYETTKKKLRIQVKDYAPW